MQKWHKRQTAECPLYPHTEDHHHILQCQSPTVTNLWNENLEEFGNQLQQMHAPEETISAMISLLNAYRTNTIKPIIVQDPTPARAVAKQQQLGPHCFIEGLLVDEWREHVSSFLPACQSKHRWIQQLIRMQWDIIFSLWTN